MVYQPIENYGIIGDMYTVALVGIDGSIYYGIDLPDTVSVTIQGRAYSLPIWYTPRVQGNTGSQPWAIKVAHLTKIK